MGRRYISIIPSQILPQTPIYAIGGKHSLQTSDLEKIENMQVFKKALSIEIVASEETLTVN